MSAPEPGKLKVFLGMCPGVGKTFAMLQAAGELERRDVDVVAGVVETHGRQDTADLLDGLEVLPRVRRRHRDTEIEELDLDALLARRPALALVDELAHTNAPGSRHVKRWQDVAELLDAGIDVFTTVNIQHLESRADVVSAISGAPVRETVPDSFLDRADEIELIDLPPSDLLRRLGEGKVYLGDRAEAAARHFFREGNLTALRQLALRYTGERVGSDLREVRGRQRDRSVWHTREHLLVAVGPSPYSPALIRRTRAMAGAIDAAWSAVAIVTDADLSPADQAALGRHLDLARELGAEARLVENPDLAAGLLDAAREVMATQIVIGKSPSKGLAGLFRTPPVSRILQASGDIDVIAIEPRMDGGKSPVQGPGDHGPRWSPAGFQWLRVALISVLLGVLGALLFPFLDQGNIALIFLSSVLVSALFLKPPATLLLALVTGLQWNFLFTEPRFTVHIASRQDLVMFGALTVSALAMGGLSSRLRRRERSLGRQQVHGARLLEITSVLSRAHDSGEACEKVTGIVSKHLGAPSSVSPRSEEDHQLLPPLGSGTLSLDAREQGVAAWCFEHAQPAGRGTGTLPEAAALHLPLRGRSFTMGVLSVAVSEKELPLPDRDFLAAAAAQLGLALERNHLLRAIHRAEFIERGEQLRRSLLDHVSHELRTPVAVLSASIDALESGTAGTTDIIPEMRDAQSRLERIVYQLIESARIESGAVQAHPEWCDLADLLEESRRRLGKEADAHPIRISVGAGVPPLVHLDPELFLAALGNILGNACRHTPDGTAVEMGAGIDGDGHLGIRVRDHGPGLADPARVFDRFHRGPDTPPGGLGLGLSIVRGLARGMGGRAEASNAPGGGAEFRLHLPVRFAQTLPEDFLTAPHATHPDH